MTDITENELNDMELRDKIRFILNLLDKDSDLTDDDKKLLIAESEILKVIHRVNLSVKDMCSIKDSTKRIEEVDNFVIEEVIKIIESDER